MWMEVQKLAAAQSPALGTKCEGFHALFSTAYVARIG